MIKRLLLAELGRAGRENICLSVRTHGSPAKYFPMRPTTQSISTYYVLNSSSIFSFLPNEQVEQVERNGTASRHFYHKTMKHVPTLLMDENMLNYSSWLMECPLLFIIIHSKYFVVSDWLQSPNLFFITNWCSPFLANASNMLLIQWHICLETRLIDGILPGN